MPDQNPTLDPRATDSDTIESEVFHMLVEQHPALVPIAELVRELTFPAQPHISSPPQFVAEAVERLFHFGLAHRVDDFAFATRAGVRAIELWG
ncbi:MAG: hypothetical protein ACTHOE_04905 [Conexibacter sp.]